LKIILTAVLYPFLSTQPMNGPSKPSITGGPPAGVTKKPSTTTNRYHLPHLNLASRFGSSATRKVANLNRRRQKERMINYRQMLVSAANTASSIGQMRLKPFGGLGGAGRSYREVPEEKIYVEKRH